MSVAVVVPFGGSCPHRERAWAWVRERYAETHPSWRVIEAPAGDGVWCKASAVNPALAGCDSEIVVLADADVWTDGLLEAVEAVRAGAPWAMPHLTVKRLSVEGTEAVLSGDDWRDQRLVDSYRGVDGGGVVIARREVLQAVPLDMRFEGWGQDDEAHAFALTAISGPLWRGEADLIHLWHPPQPRMTRRRGSQASWLLRNRYRECLNDPAAMAALMEEGRRDTCSAA